jgi:hypothetical protein
MINSLRPTSWEPGSTFSPTRASFIKLYTQWNDARQYANLNFLLRYIYHPGSDFYLMYDQRMKTADGWTLLTKLTYYTSL